MFRRTIVVLCVCWTFSSFGYESPFTERVEINLWFASSQLDGELNALAAEFSENHPAVTINVVNLPNEDLKTSVVKALRNGSTPDIAILSSDNTVYADHMQLSAFSLDHPNLKHSEDINASLTVNGKIYGLPLQRNNRMVMFYNRDIVKQPASSWESIIAKAATYSQIEVLPVGVLYDEGYWFAHFVTLFDDPLTKHDLPNLDSPSVVNAISLYERLDQLGVTDRDCGYDCVSVEFYESRVAYAINGVWALREARRALGDKLGIMALPSYKGQAMSALTSTVVMTYPNDSWNGDNQLAVRAFTDFLQSDDVQMRLTANTRMLPVKLDILNQMNNIEDILLQIELQESNLLMPPNSAFVSIWNGIRKGLMLAKSDTLDNEQAAKYMQSVALRIHNQLEQ